MVSERSSIPAIGASIDTSRGNSRRTSGSPPVSRRSVDAHVGHHPHHALDLLEAQDLVALEPGQAVGGHAVLAAEVAAVGHRDAEVGDAATVAVVERL